MGGSIPLDAERVNRCMRRNEAEESRRAVLLDVPQPWQALASLEKDEADEEESDGPAPLDI